MTKDTPSHHSTTLSKALELRFVGALSAALWRNGCRDFEILRSETDTGGYDVVVDAKGVVRHIQLKATVAGGKRTSVTVNTRLSDKPAGCVVWMRYNPETLELGPFRFLGAGPRKPLSALGDKVARHTPRKRGRTEGVPSGISCRQADSVFAAARARGPCNQAVWLQH